jgi:iron complex transport system permease protein
MTQLVYANSISIYAGAKRLLWVLLLASLLLACLGISIGSTGLGSLTAAIDAFFGAQDPSNVNSTAQIASQVIWDIRLPRTIGAWLAGTLLGLSGAIAQGLFRNPLADPYLLGSASGASLGVALALVFTGSSALSVEWGVRLGMTGAAFVGALFAVALTLLLARGLAHTLRLLLAGVVVGVVLGAGTSLLTITKPAILQAMQSFSLGSTALVGWDACWVMLVVLGVCLPIATVLSKALDGLALGEHVAVSLGFDLRTVRLVLVLALALACGAAVAQTGLIAFVGLAAPHAVRGIVSVNSRYLLLLSSLMGAVLLTLADVVSRAVIAPQELPVGIVTALLGGAYLLYLMHRQQHTMAKPSPGAP